MNAMVYQKCLMVRDIIAAVNAPSPQNLQDVIPPQFNYVFLHALAHAKLKSIWMNGTS